MFRFCSNDSSVLFHCVTPRGRTCEPYGLSLLPVLVHEVFVHAVLLPGCDGGVLGRNRGAAVPSTTCDDGQRIQGDAKKKPPRH